MPYKEQRLYILWDEDKGHRIEHLYLDADSAKIGLKEHYNLYWISSGKAKILPIEAVTYFANE